jgi:EAL domain-containing protein (putative c-di-GMP-specific phosphodiesterase class I)/GGDEF domain-containing protein
MVQRVTPIPVSADALLEAVPDLILLVRRDGLLLGCGGGSGVARLCPQDDCIGKPLESLWPEPLAGLIRRAVRKAIELRTPSEARFEELRVTYELSAVARGPDRAACVIRALTKSPLEATGEHRAMHLDRRGFLQRFKQSLSIAALRESSIAVAVIAIDGIADVAQAMTASFSEQILSASIVRLGTLSSGDAETPNWYLGQLSETLLALVLESANRDAIECWVGAVCANLREPLPLGGTQFHLSPHAGVAILGQDASSPKTLLEHARTAAFEARRSGSDRIQFFSDTLRLKSLARLDLARELREAIDSREIQLRYVGRYNLQNGRLMSWVGYLRWLHPLRGEIRPAEFLKVAETTGHAVALSRAALACLREDFVRLRLLETPAASISFGALRHHVLHEDFQADIERFLAEGAVPAERLELRIAEKTLIARNPAQLDSLRRLNLRLVVDEVGRGIGSLDWLARAPLWGLQLDRAWVAALGNTEVARKVCRAGIAVAKALGLTPIATGVDSSALRDELLELGCRYGSGDFYEAQDRGVQPELSPARAAV